MTSSPLSSREYLEQLRQRRLQRSVSGMPVEATPSVDDTLPTQEIFGTNVPTPDDTVYPANEPAIEVPVASTQFVTPAELTPAPVTPETPQFTPPVTQTVATPMPAPAQPVMPVAPPAIDYNRPEPEELIFEWTAASRPFKKRNKQFYTTIGIIVLLISLILFFAGQFLPIAVVIAAAFLAYILASVPPEIVKHQLTTYGLRVEDQLYEWDEMGRFWFTQKYGEPVLHVEVSRFPFRLTLLINNITETGMTELLSEVLLNQKPVPTFYERAADWLQTKVPLDTD